MPVTSEDQLRAIAADRAAAEQELAAAFGEAIRAGLRRTTDRQLRVLTLICEPRRGCPLAPDHTLALPVAPQWPAHIAELVWQFVIVHRPHNTDD